MKRIALLLYVTALALLMAGCAKKEVSPPQFTQSFLEQVSLWELWGGFEAGTDAAPSAFTLEVTRVVIDTTGVKFSSTNPVGLHGTHLPERS